MSQIRFLKAATVFKLVEDIPANTQHYLDADFKDLGLNLDSLSFASNSSDCDFKILKKLLIPTAANNFEAENSEIVFNAFKGITRYQGADPRLWTYFCHTTEVAQYILARHRSKFDPSDIVKTHKSIETHFIAAGQTRFLVRNNPLARLWWNYKVVSSVDDKNASEMLRVLLIDTDFRATHMERPTQFSSNAFKASLSFALLKYKESKEHIFFNAPRSGKLAGHVNHYNYRDVAKLLNRLGGYMNLSFVSVPKIVESIIRDEENFYSRSRDRASTT
jgi:hypothetical protein